MIHNIKFENFYSINDCQEMDFTSNKKYCSSAKKYNDEYYISTVNCFIGANASGKTNALKALSFLTWFMEDSFYYSEASANAMFDSYKLREAEPTKFELIFDIANKLYKYTLILTPFNVIHEKLETKSIKGFTYLYKYNFDGTNKKIEYNRNGILPKININEEKRFKLKRNATFFSFLLGTGYLENFNIKGMFSKSFSNVTNLGNRNYDFVTETVYLSEYMQEEDAKNTLLPYLKSFDFGIDNFSDEVFKIKFLNDVEKNIISFKHTSKDKEFILSALSESAGTIKGLFLTYQLLYVLNYGGIAIVDELDGRLHFDIARKLISLFSNKETNINGAQLFFSTHQPLFLNDRDKKQIFMCYKENLIDTEIYRLDDVEGVRNTENFFENYLSGKYGATPRLRNMNDVQE